MPASATLLLYFLLVLSVIVLPGMDMAFIVSSSLAGGRRAGFAAVAGVTVGGVFHMVFAMTGLVALLRVIPIAVPVMMNLGAAYIAWLGVNLLRSDGFALRTTVDRRRSTVSSFVTALATCLMNPKAYLFMLAVFPQFIHAERGPVWTQAAILSVITAATQICVYGTLAALAAIANSGAGNRIATRRNVWIARTAGSLLIVAALATVIGSLRGGMVAAA